MGIRARYNRDIDVGLDTDRQLTRLAALAEPIRRELYRFVIDQHDPVSRDQAAQGIGVPLHVAKFHLDKLAADGLLDIAYQRPAGRGGPGAGRPTKLYRAAHDEITASVPERHYDLAADVLANAVTAARDTGIAIGDALRITARDAGARLAHASADSCTTDSVATVYGVLAAHGYEPSPTSGQPDRIVLRNCPFHRLVESHADLVCRLNLDLLSGLVDSFPESGLGAQLDPGPDRCCVTLTPNTSSTTPSAVR